LDQRGTLDVNGTIFGKVMESNTLKQQAASRKQHQRTVPPIQ
jgi:hypothetical protein